MTGFETLLPRPVAARPAPGRYAVASVAAVLDPATVALDPVAVPAPGGYRLSIAENGVTAVAHDAAGAFHATQTLRQLLGPDAFRAADIHVGAWTLPCGEVEDHPRFGWRGVLLDVARHFIPKAGVLRFLDLMAAHKLNVLHFHLTDDQGWRLEVPAFPKLTEVGAWRHGSWVGRQVDGDETHDNRPHGGYYTTADLREIVAYARARQITVVPEVDVPGHSQAAIAAYPELGVTKEPVAVWHAWGESRCVLDPAESTLDFYRTVLDHVVDVFDAPFVCLGGDEVHADQWHESVAVKQRADELGLDSVAELHGWFLRELAEHLAGHGRRVLGWDEILDAGELPDGAAVASWRGEAAGVRAALAGHDVVMCPETKVYLDHRQSDHPDEPVPVGYVRTLADVRAYEPIPPDLPASAHHRVLGAQANLWSEHFDNPRRVDYAAFPRLAAFAEVVWSPRAETDERVQAEFLARVADHHLPRLDALGVEYRPPAGPRPWQRRPGVPGRAIPGR
ncbi:beta-N-acetylhexosaminidase [Actinokineospora auranticolor]|uniref:beta-N-acetylhexosaminidase n=1 Tax=Actinokineospora auranticolor TaxID=155976 RepID=A0A2S6H018_9PSEU|nr:beta-N-acetylhexosaminidase [Actinokineospora auranticolor]PPK70825.1 hexosaminidase [Actinokineospora auranticolor]